MTQPTAEQLEVTQATCIIPNCRKSAPPHEPFCAEHRRNPKFPAHHADVTQEDIDRADEMSSGDEGPSFYFARHRQATEARMAAAVEALTKAAERFREYETSHAAKGSIDGDLKALRNCEMAEMCETALAKIRSQSNG